jgi:hypothetical protein
VSALSLDFDPQTGRRGDVRHQAKVDPLLLQARALFNMQLQKLVEVAGAQRDGFKRTA